MTPRKVTMRAILLVVASEFKIDPDLMLSKSRMEMVIRPRWVAMYFCVSHMRKTLPEVGRFFDGMDHTTVLNGVRRVTSLIEKDRVFAGRVERLRERIHAIEAGLPPPEGGLEVGDRPPSAPAASGMFAVPRPIGTLGQAVETYLKARKRLEEDRFSPHEAPSRRNEEQALSALRVAHHDYLAGGRAS